MHDVFYSADYAAAGYAFPTTRKSRWVAESLASSPVSGVTLREPTPLTEDQVASVHSPEYVAAVRDGEPWGAASSSGLRWCRHMMPAVLAANGGVLAAARSAMDSGRIAGTLTSGLHHARREYGLGFCTFNGLAITAIELSGHGNVLILDLDAHGGGGTASLISGNVRIRHIDLSTDAFDCHEGTIDVSSASQVEYLERLESELRSAAPADIVIYNAGMDVHESDCGQLSVDAIAAREVMVFEWARSTRTPICYTLAGGYSERERLVGLHRCTIRAAEYHAR